MWIAYVLIAGIGGISYKLKQTDDAHAARSRASLRRPGSLFTSMSYGASGPHLLQRTYIGIIAKKLSSNAVRCLGDSKPVQSEWVCKYSSHLFDSHVPYGTEKVDKIRW